MTEISVSAGARLGSLSNSKKELLQLLRDQQSRKTCNIKPYPRGDGTGRVRLPTSWAQQRLWFIDQLEGGSPGYQVPMAMRLQGPLDQEALRKALDTLVQRHEVLRTVFVSTDGDPMQEITREGRFALRVIDLSGYERAEREAQVRLHKIDEVQEGFDLHIGPLIRGRLLRVQAEEHVLLVAMHHIIADGWSLGIFIRELAGLYEAHREGRADPLEPLPIQYADYAQWQRQQWQLGEALDRHLSYWRERLEGAAPQLELPTNRARPAVQSYRGENAGVVLDAQLSAKLKAFAQRHEMTLFMVLYAGWAILLSRLSGQEDVVIGTPVANRQRPEVEGLIGLFVNTLVLRVEVRGDLRVKKLLEQVKEVTLGAYDHQDLPFEKVVEALQPQRSLSTNPLFQVMFVLHNEPRSELRLRGLTAFMEDGVDEPSILDLWMSLEERGDEIAGYVNYAADLFDRETVERWIESFTVLLGGMIDGAQSCICDLPILPEGERRQIIESFNATRASYSHEKLIHDLFEEQVERTPDAIATVYEDQRLTYAELNSRANQLARYLRDQGVGPGQSVAICVERSLEMVVGLLAILKAGAAYVPLDPNYPTDRLQYMLEDAVPQVVLTQEKLREKLLVAQSQVIALDSKRKEIAGYAEENISTTVLELTAQNLVYVIYTSGSTGRPKGTAMAHRSMINLIEWHRKTFLANQGKRVLQFAALSFDVAFQEIFSTLSTGGTLVLLDEWIRRDATALIEFLSSSFIHRLFVPPLMLQSLAESSKSTGMAPASLQDVITAGEQLRISPEISSFFKQLNGCRLHNHYGPTESHVVTALTLVGDPGKWPALPSIGTPISNTQIYILDVQRQPVPTGVAAEIYIGGAGVARGYLNRSELTAERFVADPFSDDSKARLYKTGDLGRWQADGTLEYLGRNDDQVKIRGYRIELGEIEAQLARHAQVKEAAVVVREDVAGEKRLVAYITQREVSSPNVEELRAHLKAVLPEHMVPSGFVVLENLPLTPSGKLDRRALPTPKPGAYVSRRYEAPKGDVEATLAAIWQDLLRVEQVGRSDSFFDLGGHSLLATRVISRIREVLQVEVPLRALFEAPTVQQLSVRLKAEGHGQAAQETLRVGKLAGALRKGISEMHDEAVLARIAELEKELSHVESRQPMRGRAEH